MFVMQQTGKRTVEREMFWLGLGPPLQPLQEGDPVLQMLADRARCTNSSPNTEDCHSQALRNGSEGQSLKL